VLHAKDLSPDPEPLPLRCRISRRTAEKRMIFAKVPRVVRLIGRDIAIA
jgi:hypothetical protein